MSDLYDLMAERTKRIYGPGKKTPEQIMDFHAALLKAQGFPICFLSLPPQV